MSKFLVTAMMMASFGVCADEVTTVSAEQWASPIHGESVASMPSLAAAVDRLQATSGGVLSLYHSGGDEGVIWAQELRAWMISLGVSSRQIELLSGNPREDVIEITVKEVGGSE